jgi:leucyl aminopeptidase (aminopeptidase T)
MIESAKKALKGITNLKPKEKVVVITDKKRGKVGNVFSEAARSFRAEVKIWSLPEKHRPLKVLPEDLPLEGDLFINVFEAHAEETPFRIELIKAEVKEESRLIHGPGITKEMLRKGGPIDINYKELQAKTKELVDAFEGAESAWITTPAGTDIALEIAKRGFSNDLKITKGHWGNIPAGEIWCAPHEASANGRIVCDGSIGDFGFPPSEVEIEVKEGKITKLFCEDKNFEKLILDALSVDEMASQIGELGVGLNPNAKITGNLLEDEKAGKTLHLAFGHNLDMIGGKNSSCTHRDFLMRKPNLKVKYQNGKESLVMKKGEIIV